MTVKEQTRKTTQSIATKLKDHYHKQGVIVPCLIEIMIQAEVEHGMKEVLKDRN